MKITVKRYTTEPEVTEAMIDYEVDLQDATLLEVLTHIKTKLDPSLAFASGCRSAVCGSCAMRANGTEVLACTYHPKEGDVIEPLRNMPVVRDLVVDADAAQRMNVNTRAWSSENGENVPVTQADEKMNEIQSDCILCGSCFSACPVYAVNENFIGPFALTRSWRYVSDSREQDTQEKIEAVQANGIWDCTLCNECVPVCPQGIAPKQDISMLRNKSGILGFMDPSFSSGMGFQGGFGSPSFDGTPDFGGGF
ncbi:MAG: 2Fe-2S iron-sulfur cluster-binding protein [Sulfurimonadaceae bacterium]|nr:2Fe-2S iron-sulfur cluster-binding protein [Sulfurimonadaceae bacterium]